MEAPFSLIDLLMELGVSAGTVACKRVYQPANADAFKAYQN